MDRINPNARKGERDSLECSVSIVFLSQFRQNREELGKPLAQWQKNSLQENCGSIDFGKWVEDEKAQLDKHKGMEAMKKRQ